MVFSKSYCPYCQSAKKLLDGLNAKYGAYELNEHDDGRDMQDALFDLTGQRTVPNIFIGGDHIGGNSDLVTLSNKGKGGKKIQDLLREAGAL